MNCKSIGLQTFPHWVGERQVLDIRCPGFKRRRLDLLITKPSFWIYFALDPPDAREGRDRRRESKKARRREGAKARRRGGAVVVRVKFLVNSRSATPGSVAAAPA